MWGKGGRVACVAVIFVIKTKEFAVTTEDLLFMRCHTFAMCPIMNT